MTLPVPRAPDLQCPVCEVVFDVLDSATTAVLTEPQSDPTVGEAHLLASVIHWWTGNALEKYRDDLKPLFSMLADALMEHGVDLQQIAKAQRQDTKQRLVRVRVH